MLELPESSTIVKQLNQVLKGKTIEMVKANHSPHSFTWYFGDPKEYDELLAGKQIGEAYARSGMIEIEVEDCRLLFGDGASLRYYDDINKIPAKHQLLIEFNDETALVVTVQMYGGIWAYQDGANDNPYYLAAKNAISPLSADFNFIYFSSLRNEKTGRLSLKAFLATEQRIPGLGNGVLQDILFFAKLHPKRKLNTLTEEEFQTLYQSVKAVIGQMTDGGGRDTERDLFGNSGGYMTYLSKKTVWTPCPVCGYELHKGNYMGGTIYYCEKCQK